MIKATGGYKGGDRIGQDSVCGQDDLQGKPRLKEVNRKQLLLRPVDVEELVSVDHPVRAIWEIAGRLNLEEYLENTQAVEGVAGRPPADPRVLVSLWVYGCSMGVSSARELSRMYRSEAGCQWLTGLEEVNHHSLSDFRVSHGKAHCHYGYFFHSYHGLQGTPFKLFPRPEVPTPFELHRPPISSTIMLRGKPR